MTPFTRAAAGLMPGIALVALLGCQPAGPNDAGAATRMLQEARAQGASDAKAAHAKGTLLLKEYPPLPSPAEHGEYVKLLKEKCNCDYEVVMKEFDPVLQAEVVAWNDITKAAIQAKHGDGIFDELHAEARKNLPIRNYTWRLSP